MPRTPWLALVSGLALCLGTSALGTSAAAEGLPDWAIEQYGERPLVPDGPLSEDVAAAIDTVLIFAVSQAFWRLDETEAFETLARSEDPRVGWILADIMRFAWRPEFAAALADTGVAILGIDVARVDTRSEMINHLLAWDVPAYPGYLLDKRAVFTNFLPGLEFLFLEGDIAWEQVAWGGVGIDDRPFGQTDALCNCIPAADNPEVSHAADATWLSDEAIVFGLVINGEARAYPRRIMEIREMVNDTLGGRDIAMPYCTLCGAAQAYFTDALPEGVERPVLRTSGLLIRSNKVMYDVVTYSVFDTFTGEAVTGPLGEIGLSLEQATVITTTWGDWRAAHPDTTVLVEALALGRDWDLRNTRDADGPIFPVGDVDPRLPVHEDVIGVFTASGAPLAFQRSTAMAALLAGQEIVVENVRLELAAGGLRAVDLNGSDLGSHQAFWFAWSQFHPDTALWTG